MISSSASEHGAAICVICLGNFGALEHERRASALACGHTFHEDCLVQLQSVERQSSESHGHNNIQCPLCRFDRRQMEILIWRAGFPYPGSGGGLMLHRSRMIISDGSSRVLLVQERDHSWNLPGGHLEKQDRVGYMGSCEDLFMSLEACARREVFEETGLFCASKQLTRFDIIENQAVYEWKAEHFSWWRIRSAWDERRRLQNGRRNREIRGVWWGQIESALAESSITDVCRIALTMLSTR